MPGPGYVNVLTGKLALTFTILTTLVIAAVLALASATMDAPARAIMSQSYLDARWLYAAAAVSGVAYCIHFRSDHLRALWVVLLGLCCLGRGLDLLFVGDPFLTRTLELRGALTWVAIFMAGVVCALLLTAYSLLHDERVGWGDHD